MPKSKKVVESKVAPEIKAEAKMEAATHAPVKAAKKPYKKPEVKSAPAPATVPVAAEVEVEVSSAPQDFMMFVGDAFYTKEEFISEAASIGVSKRLPSFRVPSDLKVKHSKVWLAAGGGRKGEAAKIFGYFVPDAIEFIAGTEGEKTYADIIAHIKTLEGSKIVKSISGEAIRKCGVRKVGGTYLTAKAGTQTPLHITTEQDYKGNFFRGMLRLTPEHATALASGKGIETMVSDSCMVCFTDILTSKDSATRAGRERRRMEKGEAPKWLLRCDKCGAAHRAEKRTEKAPSPEPVQPVGVLLMNNPIG